MDQSVIAVRMENMNFWKDLRFGLRLLVRSPGASLVAILALGLGIGANAAIFSVANGILLHPLPYANLNRLLDVSEVPPHAPPTATNAVSGFNYATWKQQAHVFAAMTAYNYNQVNLSGTGTPVSVTAAQVDADFFTTLPARPLRGRTFLPEENQPGHDHEVILSQTLWAHRFAANPHIIGQTVEVNQQAYTVVGVLPKSAVMPQGAQMWLPLALTAAQRNDHGNHDLSVIGELAPGMTLARAQAEMRGIAARVDARYPATNADWGVDVQTLAQRSIGGPQTASYVWLLLGAVGFLLLIACANVANLQFARALRRNHELSLRVALGASRWRLMRQILTENILLGLGGALVGVAFAAVSIRLIVINMPADVAVYVGGWYQIKLNGVVLAYMIVIAVLAGILAGLAPAWHAARPELNATLREGGRGAIGHSRRRLRSSLVVVQICLALILLVGAGLMVAGFEGMLHKGDQFAPDRTLTASILLPDNAAFQQASARADFYQKALTRLAAIPGIQEAATASSLPLSNNFNENAISISGRPIANASQQRYAVVQSISARFLPMMNVPLIAGRAFTASDGAETQPVVLINQRLARRYFAGRNPLGQQIKLGKDSSTRPWATVVGVVGDVHWAWGSEEAEPTVYRPADQYPLHSAFFLLRSSGSADVTGFGPAMREAVAAIDAQDPLAAVESLHEVIHESSIGIAYVAVLLSVAGVLALILAAIGVYGVMAYLVSERVHEFGIRQALGASRGNLMALVARRGASMLLWGIVIGLPLAYGLAQLLQSLITAPAGSSWMVYAAICGLLALMTTLACYVPALHATRVDPLVALREP